MSYLRKVYETVLDRALSIVKFQNSEAAASNTTARNRLKAASRQGKTLNPLPSGVSPGKSSGIVCGINSVAAIEAEKERDSAVKRARVTSTRLTALKTYLEQEAN
ncbi:MAG: hypothetical protein C0508_12800 [Cyanobacteria bacterium PR.023]|jgi:hypothetical protein|nr:hypothetical protein [Cyanobacteria bacterium PR.023]MDQ5935656.1 hypothetical protein [Cyanobacteriota bacterium erpe_2018_sw_21hr_WHONDRS-SW48-000092_B_bin.40]